MTKQSVVHFVIEAAGLDSFVITVNGGGISGLGAEERQASWARSPTCKGARSGPFACRRRKFFPAMSG
jgi:hypothetical protein